MSFSVFWNFSWFVHGYVHKICLNKYRVSCILEQYVINKYLHGFEGDYGLIALVRFDKLL